MSELEININANVFLDIYRPLYRTANNYDIDFYYGGRDGGKSYFIAQCLILDCLQAEHFQCVLARKVEKDIRESQYTLIKNIIQQWKLTDYFVFKSSPLSIECTLNTNRFIVRGFEDASRIKSLTDFNVAWVEEGNQLTEEDFLTLVTTLRSNRGKVTIKFSFNPECEIDFNLFWLYKNWFAHTSDVSFIHNKEIKVSEERTVTLKIRATHTTYKDNLRFVTPVRMAFLENLKVSNPYYYKVYALGLWGNKEVTDPFAFNFNRDIHLSNTAPVRNHPLILSFDFNRNPITCFVAQIINNEVIGVEQIKLSNSDIYKLCDYILLHYPNYLYDVTGDATGQNSSALVQDNLNYYKVIKHKLNTGINKVPSINPPLKENRVLVNLVLQAVKCSFHPAKCSQLIYDFENVSVLASGEIDKSNRLNPSQQADALDCFRYFCNTYYKYLLKMPLK